MPSPLTIEIRTHLARYLAGNISLRDVDAWFAPATLNVERRGDPLAEALVFELFLRLAEYSNGDCTEAELKELLRPLVETETAAALHHD